jgi:Tfp pilus assembly protein PilF
LVSNHSMHISSESRPFYLKFPLLILCLLTLVVYFKVATLGFTDLDDKFFIVRNEQFNQDPGNIATAFGRGLFGPTNDLYYRPLLLVDFIIEHAFFGTNPWGYHLTNLLFHILTVCLLFIFFKKIKIREVDALILAALFAVHPVLSQAVAWIPGRNDMLLMIFFLTVLISTIQYYLIREKGNKPLKWLYFLTQFVLLLLALFTKETAVVIPLVVALVLVYIFNKPLKSLLPIIISSAVAILIWFISRSMATLLNEPTAFPKLVSTGLGRIPAMIQYVGKIFFPVNLSVYPLMEDTTIAWGILAVVLLALLVIFSKSYFKPLTIIGLLWFLIFLAPVLIVPISLNDQVFEHRLYIPIAGMLILLSQTMLFSEKWKNGTKMIIATGIILLLAGISFSRIGYYKDVDTFWRKAITDSPHAIMPRMMLVNGITITPNEREEIRKECYTLDPDQMMVHYTLGKIYIQMNQYDSAKRQFSLELPYSQFADIYYQLGLIYSRDKNFDSTVYCFEKVVSLEPNNPNTTNIEAMIHSLKLQHYMEKAQTAVNTNEPDTAASYLQKVILLDPGNTQAHYNLVLLYFNMKQKQKAREVIGQMQSKGLKISPELLKLIQQ